MLGGYPVYGYMITRLSGLCRGDTRSAVVGGGGESSVKHVYRRGAVGPNFEKGGTVMSSCDIRMERDGQPESEKPLNSPFAPFPPLVHIVTLVCRHKILTSRGMNVRQLCLLPTSTPTIPDHLLAVKPDHRSHLQSTIRNASCAPGPPVQQTQNWRK